MGEIIIIHGPMFSGKTTELLRQLRVMRIAKRSCVLIRPLTDTRAARCHSGEEHPDGAIVLSKLSGSAEQMQPVQTADFIAIDEAQFFDPEDLKSFASWAAGEGKKIVMAMLDGDFMQRPFPAFSIMVPISDTTQKLSAVCMKCQNLNAPFTIKLGSDTGSSVVDIGGADKYQAVCRACLN